MDTNTTLKQIKSAVTQHKERKATRDKLDCVDQSDACLQR